jgi:hypothetical protein
MREVIMFIALYFALYSASGFARAHSSPNADKSSEQIVKESKAQEKQDREQAKADERRRKEEDKRRKEILSRIQSQYDRFDDTSTLGIQEAVAEFSTSGFELDFGVQYVYKSAQLNPNGELFLVIKYGVFRTSNELSRFDLILLTDGQPLNVGGMEVINSYSLAPNTRTVLLRKPIAFSTLLQIANANSVQGRFGGVMEFHLTEKHLAILKELVSRLPLSAEASAPVSETPQPEISPSPAANQGKQPAAITPGGVNPLVGLWLISITNASNQTNTFTFEVEEDGGNNKCFMVDNGVREQLTDCTVSGDRFSFKLTDVPSNGQRYDTIFSGRLEGSNLIGNMVANSHSGISITLPLMGKRLTQ